MLVSPRSLARKPLLMGGILVILLAGAIYLVVSLAESRPGPHEEALEEHARTLDEERVARKMEHYHPPKPLCDDTPPDASTEERAWLDYLSCLEERRRDPKIRAAEARRARRYTGDRRVRPYLYRALSEVDDGEALISELRGALDSAKGPTEKVEGERALARALVNHGFRSWEEDAGEARRLLEDLPDLSRCDARLAAAWIHLSDAPEVARGHLAGYLESDACLPSAHSGDLDELMERIAVSTAVSLVDAQHDLPGDLHEAVLRNYEVKSTFAMCQEAVPHHEVFTARCEDLLTGQ